MDSASRMYERLGQIPQDPEDPESLVELLVCAFGAFERFYICWKTKSGDFRHDGHDLPDALRDWLYPDDGTTRDFATLQVVFGRGEEYFASDKNGKLEYKEPEVKKPETPVEAILEKPALKRSRTISFMSQRSDSSGRQRAPSIDSPTMENSSRRSPSNSQSSTRPPGTSLTRVISDPAIHMADPSHEILSSPESSRRSSIISHQSGSSYWPTSDAAPRSFSPVAEQSGRESPVESIPAQPRLIRRSTRPLSMSFNAGAFPKITEGKKLSPDARRDSGGEHHCSCCQHHPANKPNYSNASVQTDPEPLRVDTRSDVTSQPPSLMTYSNRSSGFDYDTPIDEPDPYPPQAQPGPFFMGRMLDYFGNPGYQLGDSLSSSYSYYPVQQPAFEKEVIYEEDWK